MRRLVSVTTTFVALAISACQINPRTPVVIPTPHPGEALLYVFRPTADEVAVRDLPFISIDGQPPVVLARASYLLAHLAPGKHVLVLKPGAKESESWNAEQAFFTEGGEVYFVAVWHQNQPASSTSTVAIPFKHSLIFIPIGGHAGTLSGVQLEPVDREIGSIGLAGLKRVEP